MHLVLTKLSFVHGYTGTAQYMRDAIGLLAAHELAVVVVSPRKSLFNVETSRLTVVSADNIAGALLEIEANHREFDGETTADERIYIGFALIDRARLDALASGTAGRMSLDEQIISALLQRKAA